MMSLYLQTIMLIRRINDEEFYKVKELIDKESERRKEMITNADRR